MVFAFANEQLDHNIRYKKPLQAPSKLSIRRKERERGKRLYEAAEIRKLVKAADPHLRAMILLGINCGFGPRDCCTIPADAIDLKGGWHDYPRPKTEVDRRCPLWPETVRALKAVMGKREAFNGRVWSRHIVAREFTKLAKGMQGPQLGPLLITSNLRDCRRDGGSKSGSDRFNHGPLAQRYGQRLPAKGI